MCENEYFTVDEEDDDDDELNDGGGGGGGSRTDSLLDTIRLAAGVGSSNHQTIRNRLDFRSIDGHRLMLPVAMQPTLALQQSAGMFDRIAIDFGPRTAAGDDGAGVTLPYETAADSGDNRDADDVDLSTLNNSDFVQLLHNSGSNLTASTELLPDLNAGNENQIFLNIPDTDNVAYQLIRNANGQYELIASNQVDVAAAAAATADVTEPGYFDETTVNSYATGTDGDNCTSSDLNTIDHLLVNSNDAGAGGGGDDDGGGHGSSGQTSFFLNVGGQLYRAALPTSEFNEIVNGGGAGGMVPSDDGDCDGDDDGATSVKSLGTVLKQESCANDVYDMLPSTVSGDSVGAGADADDPFIDIDTKQIPIIDFSTSPAALSDTSDMSEAMASLAFDEHQNQSDSSDCESQSSLYNACVLETVLRLEHDKHKGQSTVHGQGQGRQHVLTQPRNVKRIRLLTGGVRSARFATDTNPNGNFELPDGVSVSVKVPVKSTGGGGGGGAASGGKRRNLPAIIARRSQQRVFANDDSMQAIRNRTEFSSRRKHVPCPGTGSKLVTLSPSSTMSSSSSSSSSSNSSCVSLSTSSLTSLACGSRRKQTLTFVNRPGAEITVQTIKHVRAIERKRKQYSAIESCQKLSEVIIAEDNTERHASLLSRDDCGRPVDLRRPSSFSVYGNYLRNVTDADVVRAVRTDRMPEQAEEEDAATFLENYMRANNINIDVDTPRPKPHRKPSIIRSNNFAKRYQQKSTRPHTNPSHTTAPNKRPLPTPTTVTNSKQFRLHNVRRQQHSLLEPLLDHCDRDRDIDDTSGRPSNGDGRRYSKKSKTSTKSTNRFVSY